MSQTQYNSFISNLLNQKHAFAKLKAELEERKEKICQCCIRFRHLAQNCRNKKEERKRKSISQNKFKVLASRVIRCGVEEVIIRRQETKEKKVMKCFRCWKKEHYKWKCLNIEVKRRRQEKATVCVVMLQKVQQKEKLVYFLWKKAQEYSSTWSMSLKKYSNRRKEIKDQIESGYICRVQQV